MNDIGQKIRQLRRDAGMTQDELAERIAVTRQTVSNYERGIARPGVDVLMNIAEVFGVPSEDLMGYARPENAKQKQQNALRHLILAAAIVFTCLTFHYTSVCIYDAGNDWPLILSVHVFRPLLVFFSGFEIIASVQALTKRKRGVIGLKIVLFIAAVFAEIISAICAVIGLFVVFQLLFPNEIRLVVSLAQIAPILDYPIRVNNYGWPAYLAAGALLRWAIDVFGKSKGERL